MKIDHSTGKSMSVKSAVSEMKLHDGLFFLILFAVQILFTFQGVDICDGGSYANFYQQFFNNPESVQYSFMFWLSGLVGGSFLKLLPGLGMWGLRLLGVATVTATIFVSYKLLKNYLNKGYLQLSLFILTIFINNNPKEFYYNNLSALLYILVAFSLFAGLRSDRPGLFLLSGAIAALNVFNRTPNILGIGIASGIFYYGHLYRINYKKQIRQCLIFLTGVLLCSGLVLLTMQLMGQLNLFEHSLKLVFLMGKTSKQIDGIESSYGILNLINLLYAQYKFSLIAAILFFTFILFIVPSVRQIKNKFPSALCRILLSKYIFISLIIILIVIRKIDHISIIYFMTGICLTTAAAVFVTNKNREISILMFLGIFIAVIHPLGSSTGIHTVIIYSLWLAFPIAVEYLFTITHAELNLKYSGKFADFSSPLNLSGVQLRDIKNVSAGLLIFACFYFSFFYPYFDRTNRLYMHYSIHNRYMAGIFTSKKRADAINGLLQESYKYVKADDYVLAYDCMPLYHYLTNTKPYLGNPWPWLYQPDAFNSQLIRSSTEIKTRPVVIMQLVRTMGPNGAKWPDFSSGETTFNWNLNETRNEILLKFLKANRYKEVWTNNIFSIFIPEATSGSVN